MWMSRITTVDAFYIGFFHGADRILIPYHFDGNDLDEEPGSMPIVPGGVSAWVRDNLRTYRYSFDDGAVLKRSKPFGDVTRASADVLTAPLFRTPTARLQAETAELVLHAHRAAEGRFRSLTRREQEVALLLVKDLSNAGIAAWLRLSERTVKIHVGNILKKYAAKQRASVIAELRRFLD